MMKTNRIAKLITIFLMLAGCNSDFLDRFPKDQIPESTFFTSENDLYIASNALYTVIDIKGISFLENLTDNSTAQVPWAPEWTIPSNMANAENGSFSSTWTKYYRFIQAANRIIEGAPKVQKITEGKRSQYTGEARFMRAYLYELLIELYGDVPLLTSSITPDEGRQVTRTDKNEVRKFVLDELTAAASILPISSTEWGRATKGAALALKTRVLLYDGKWAECAATAKEVMDLKLYSLYPDYNKLFTYEGERCSEIIFARQYSDIVGQTHTYTQEIGSQSLGGYGGFAVLKSFVDTYECIDGLTINESPLYNEKTPWKNRDPRLYATVLYPGHKLLDGVWSSTMDGFNNFNGAKVYLDDNRDKLRSSWNETQSGYQLFKYLQERDYQEKKFVSNQSIDFILLRYAEVLLNYAEAKIESGNIDQSVYDAINMVRQRPSVSMPLIKEGANLRECVRRERRVELGFEGLRLQDLKRWGILEAAINDPEMGAPLANPETVSPIVYRQNWIPRKFVSPRDYLWAIPQTQLDLNKNLKQNPGW